MKQQEIDSATTLPQAKDPFSDINITTTHPEKETWQDLIQHISCLYETSLLNPAIPSFPG